MQPPPPPPPDYQLTPDPITEQEVNNAVKSLPSKKSPGKDGVTYETLKVKIKKITPALTTIFNICLTHCRVPNDWKQGVISLVPKTLIPSLDITEWRPISLLSSFYKLFMTIIQKRVMTWIVDTQRLSCRQKGSMPRDGLQEHVFCMKAAVSDFMHSSSKQFITFVDLADAFGSVNHDFMITAMRSAGYPDFLIDITRDIYTDSSFLVKTNGGVTRPISRHRGVIQGCPWSVICFEQTIDAWLRWVDLNSPPTRLPAPIQGYVDDISMSAKSETELKTMAQKTELFLDAADMRIKHRKCAILQGQRSGNSWYKNSKTDQIQIRIQNENLPVFDRESEYPYLGHQIRIDNKDNTPETLIDTFKDTLQKIDRSFLPTSAKIQAINSMCISKLNFYFPNTQITEADLKVFEDEIVSYARHWLRLNNSSTRAFFFLPRSKGGLGIISPKIAYYSKHLQFHLSVLNSDDPAVRAAARESLTLHMTKRKANESRDESSFAGYETSGSKIVKNSKVYWPRSNWVHLFEMCYREDIKLQTTYDDTYEYIHNVLIDGTISPVHCEHPKAFYTMYKEAKLQRMEAEFRSLSSQGRICREAADDADMRLSSACLVNHKLSDDIQSFVARGRLQLLQSNSLMHVYYGTSRECAQCGFYTETLSHILNGCRKMKLMYQKRHNRIVDMLYSKITSMTIHKDCTIIKDSIIRPNMFDPNAPSYQHFRCPATRPDIVIINEEEKTALIIEFASPYDPFLGKCYDEKFCKYFPLTVELSELGYYSKVIVLIIGSLGLVHKKFTSGLKIIGLNNSDTKFTAKYFSTSVLIGSFKIWKNRCKNINFHV